MDKGSPRRRLPAEERCLRDRRKPKRSRAVHWRRAGKRKDFDAAYAAADVERQANLQGLCFTRETPASAKTDSRFQPVAPPHAAPRMAARAVATTREAAIQGTPT